MRWESLRLPRRHSCSYSATDRAWVYLWNWWWSDARDHGSWGNSGSDVYRRRRRDPAWTAGCSQATRRAQAQWCDRCDLIVGTSAVVRPMSQCLADLAAPSWPAGSKVTVRRAAVGHRPTSSNVRCRAVPAVERPSRRDMAVQRSVAADVVGCAVRVPSPQRPLGCTPAPTGMKCAFLGSRQGNGRSRPLFAAVVRSCV